MINRPTTICPHSDCCQHDMCCMLKSAGCIFMTASCAPVAVLNGGIAVSLCPLPVHAGTVISSHTSLAFYPGSAVQSQSSTCPHQRPFSPSLLAGCGCARSLCPSPCVQFSCCPFLSCPMRCCSASLTATTCSGSMDLSSVVLFIVLWLYFC